MSAWVVTKKHVAAIMRYAAEKHALRADLTNLFPSPDPHWRFYWANKLLQKNVDSVNYRYTEVSHADVVTRRDLRTAPELSHVEFVKAVHCLRYQSCEEPNYDGMIECKFLSVLENGVLQELAVADHEELPGYDKAPWGIE